MEEKRQHISTNNVQIKTAVYKEIYAVKCWGKVIHVRLKKNRKNYSWKIQQGMKE